MTFGQNLKSLRIKANLTQYDIASYLSISLGRKNIERAHKCVGTGMIITTIISIFLSVVSLLFIIFRKDNCSYHDLLSYSKVIDYHYIELDDEKKK